MLAEEAIHADESKNHCCAFRGPRRHCSPRHCPGSEPRCRHFRHNRWQGFRPLNISLRPCAAVRFSAPAASSAAIPLSCVAGGREFRHIIPYRRGSHDRQSLGAKGRLHHLRTGGGSRDWQLIINKYTGQSGLTSRYFAGFGTRKDDHARSTRAYRGVQNDPHRDRP